MTDEERARKLQNDLRFENALQAMKDAVGATDDNPASAGVMAISLATAAFVAVASILEARELATLEQSLEALVLVMDKMTENMKQNRRLASILGQQ